MKFKLLLFCLIVFLFLNGCAQTPQQIDSKTEELTEENSLLKEQVVELEIQVDNLKNKMNDLIEENNEYSKQLDDFYLSKITGDIDLIYWDRDHIVRALGYYNDKFKSTVWQTYEYRRDKKDFYWAFNSSLGFISDPFFELRRKDKDTELDFFHFRVERLDLDYNRTLANEKYDSYKNDILRESQIDPDLTCYEQTACRGIKVVKCTKDNKDYYGWFAGSYLFTTRFDNREALDAFEKFYCYTDPYASLV